MRHYCALIACKHREINRKNETTHTHDVFIIITWTAQPSQHSHAMCRFSNNRAHAYVIANTGEGAKGEPKAASCAQSEETRFTTNRCGGGLAVSGFV